MHDPSRRRVLYPTRKLKPDKGFDKSLCRCCGGSGTVEMKGSVVNCPECLVSQTKDGFSDRSG